MFKFWKLIKYRSEWFNSSNVFMSFELYKFNRYSLVTLKISLSRFKSDFKSAATINQLSALSK